MSLFSIIPFFLQNLLVAVAAWGAFSWLNCGMGGGSSWRNLLGGLSCSVLEAAVARGRELSQLRHGEICVCVGLCTDFPPKTITN